MIDRRFNKVKGGIGKSIAKFDVIPKVLGEAVYPQDFNLPEQLFAKVRWSEHPHARLLSLDVSQAEALPGVVRVITSQDVPNNYYGINLPDQMVFVPVGEKVTSIADRLAMVVADSEKIASRACRLIRAEYELLPVVEDVRQAMQEGAELVHPERGESNIFEHIKIRKGDVAAGFTEADVIVEGEYETPCQEHAYMQPDAGIGYIDEEGRIAVIVATQAPHDDLPHIASILKVKEQDICIILPGIGGAFGGREDMHVHHLLALAASLLKRPVKLVYSRQETTIRTGHRHPFTMRYKTGATHEGIITAMEIELIADGGAALSSSVWMLNNAASSSGGPYRIPNARVDAYGVYTNNVMNMAMRGFGAPQVAFGYEMQMNKLAEALGMDPVEVRMCNLLEDGDIHLTGYPMPRGVGVKETLRQAAMKAGWKEEDGGHWTAPQIPACSDPQKMLGIGVASSYKNVGFSCGMDDKSHAKVFLWLDEAGQIDTVSVLCGAADLGQGSQTVLAQIAAETLGVSVDKINIPLFHTSYVPYAGSSSASRQTYVSGNAVVRASQEAISNWHTALRNETGERVIAGECEYHTNSQRPTSYFAPETGLCDPHISYGYASQIALVEVDLLTGRSEVLKLWTSQDCGRMINPDLVQGQVDGAIHMGIGYTLMEDYVQENGRPLKEGFTTYLIPTVLDMPKEVESITIEVADPTGPFGAKGVGEMALLPIPAAIAAAVRDAAGVWVDKLPISAERLWRTMRF
jgi:CO/xanthine dehydrogenase Mo-binding subunit